VLTGQSSSRGRSGVFSSPKPISYNSNCFPRDSSLPQILLSGARGAGASALEHRRHRIRKLEPKLPQERVELKILHFWFLPLPTYQ
jgi:hypothetical protein